MGTKSDETERREASTALALSDVKKANSSYEEGLALWRSPDLANSSCSFCHSAEGLELAAYNFSDETIRRRATPHLGPAGAEKIVGFIHAVREKYGIKRLLDPMNDRPLQPGGGVLPGATAKERDAAFGKELEHVLPALTKGELTNRTDEKQAWAELSKCDPWKLKIGIPFNRISEDKFHGKDHATLADWICDTPLELHFPWPAYSVVQDQYLADPSRENLLSLVRFPHHKQVLFTLSQQMTNDKYRALTIYQHLLRRQLTGNPIQLGSSFFADTQANSTGLLPPLRKGGLAAQQRTRAMLPPNPLFELGLLAQRNEGTPLSKFGFPSDTLSKKHGGPSDAAQLRQIALPSLWAGWLMDQSLEHTDVCTPNEGLRALVGELIKQGYPLHALFVIAKQAQVAGEKPDAELLRDLRVSAPGRFESNLLGFGE